MTADQYRRQVRADLHKKRCRDKDHSEARLWIDARTLDVLMTRKGFPVRHPTTWGTSPVEIAAREARRGASTPRRRGVAYFAPS